MNHQHLETAREDLRYIRDVLGREGDQPMPLYSRIMWATYSLVGLTLLDFWPHWGGNFMLLGVLVGTAAEFFFAALIDKRDKEKNKARELKPLCHILAFNLSIAAIVILAFRGVFTPGYGLGQMIMIVVGYHFITCGLLYPPKLRLRWNAPIILGLGVLLGAVLVSFFDHGVWTGMGILTAVMFGMGFEFPKTRQHPSAA